MEIYNIIYLWLGEKDSRYEKRGKLGNRGLEKVGFYKNEAK